MEAEWEEIRGRGLASSLAEGHGLGHVRDGLAEVLLHRAQQDVGQIDGLLAVEQADVHLPPEVGPSQGLLRHGAVLLAAHPHEHVAHVG